ALIGRALLPIGVLVVFIDRTARDDRGFAVRAVYDFAQIEILNRHAVDVVGVGPARRIELRLPDRLGERHAVVEFPAVGLEAGRDDARAVIGLGRVVRGIAAIGRDEVLHHGLVGRVVEINVPIHRVVAAQGGVADRGERVPVDDEHGVELYVLAGARGRP